MLNELICICCGGQEWKKVCHLPSIFFKVSADILRCKFCGCGVTWPIPFISSMHYEKNGQYVQLFAMKEKLYLSFAHQLLSALDGIVDPAGKTLLDVGCGGGFMVRAAKEKGFRAQGIEANEELVEWARTKGLDVVRGDVRQLREENKRYDVIVLSAILEHLEHPQLLLESCKEILSDNGLILVSQASYDGLLPVTFPWGWYGWQPKEHYWHFTPNAFEKFSASRGFVKVLNRRGSLYHTFFIRGGVQVLVGRNLATILARVGQMFKKGDSFDMVLKFSQKERF